MIERTSDDFYTEGGRQIVPLTNDVLCEVVGGLKAIEPICPPHLVINHLIFQRDQVEGLQGGEELEKEFAHHLGACSSCNKVIDEKLSYV